MARKHARRNKSALIREMLETIGLEASPGAVVEAMKAKNIAVTPPQVSNVKLQMRKKQGLKAFRGGRPPVGKRGRPAGSDHNGTVNLEMLLAAKDLANKLGGVQAAKQALEVLSRLN